MAGTAAFSPGPTYAATGAFTSVGKWLDGAESTTIGAREYLREYIDAPGVDGTITKSFGFRRQKIELHVVYCDTSEDAVTSAWETDTQAMANTASTLTLNGVTYYGCFLDAEASRIVGMTESGLSDHKVIAKAVIVTISTRLA